MMNKNTVNDANYIPLAVRLYGVKVLNDLPCGCQMWVLASGDIEHFVSLKCPRNEMSKIKIDGYFFREQVRHNG